MNLSRNRISDEKNTIIIDGVRKSGHILEKKIIKFLFCYYDKDSSKVHSNYAYRTWSRFTGKDVKIKFGKIRKEDDFKKVSLNNKKARWVLCKITTQNYNYDGIIIGTKQHYQGFTLSKENIHLYIECGIEGRFTPKGMHTNNVIQNSKDYDQSLLVY